MPENVTSTLHIIGITGPTGSGKSAVSAVLSAEGYQTIDADAVARFVTKNDKQALRALSDAFGEGIFLEDGTLNRRALGEIAFSSKEKTALLNDTIFPFIRTAIQSVFLEHERNGETVVFLDAPTLFESGIHEECHGIITVIADADIRRKRLLLREPDLTEQQILDRIKAQPPDDFYTKQSDYIIWNNEDIVTLEEEVKQVLDKIIKSISEMR